MRRIIWLLLMASMFWANAQAIEMDGTNLTIIHDKESGDEKEGEEEEEEEEEPDCD